MGIFTCEWVCNIKGLFLSDLGNGLWVVCVCDVGVAKWIKLFFLHEGQMRYIRCGPNPATESESSPTVKAYVHIIFSYCGMIGHLSCC